MTKNVPKCPLFDSILEFNIFGLWKRYWFHMQHEQAGLVRSNFCPEYQNECQIFPDFFQLHNLPKLTQINCGPFLLFSLCVVVMATPIALSANFVNTPVEFKERWPSWDLDHAKVTKKSGQPLHIITLGQHKSNNNNQLITLIVINIQNILGQIQMFFQNRLGVIKKLVQS